MRPMRPAPRPHDPQPTLVERALAMSRERQQLGRQGGRTDQADPRHALLAVDGEHQHAVLGTR